MSNTPPEEPRTSVGSSEHPHKKDSVIGRRRITAVLLGAILLIVFVTVVVKSIDEKDKGGNAVKADGHTPKDRLLDREPSVSFDTEECLATRAKRMDTGKKVRKTRAFCEAQARLDSVDPRSYLGNTEPKKHHGPKGRVSWHGWKGLAPQEQLPKAYTWAAEDPIVAASFMECYGIWSAKKADRLREVKPGSDLHREAFVDLDDVLTDEETGFTPIKYTKKLSGNVEGRSGDGVRTSTPMSGTGEEATQVTTSANSLPSGDVARPHVGLQLDKCLNCVTDQPSGVVTKQPGRIPPNAPPPVTPPPPGSPPPDRPGKPQVNLQDIPSTQNGGSGRDLPPAPQTQYPGPPPRVRKPPTPVVTPPDRGGSYRPNVDPAPQNDSGGGQVQEPTGPSAPMPDPGPNTGNGGGGSNGGTPQPPPEGAPPPCC